MWKVGSRIQSRGGRRLRVDDDLGGGLEGETLRVVDEDTGVPGVAKLFKDQSARALRLRRTQFLIDQSFESTCPVVVAPQDVIDMRSGYGHLARFAEGADLETFFQGPNPPLVSAVQAALVLAHAVDAMHQKGIAHGDLHFKNVRIKADGPVMRVSLIDLDGFAAPKFPGLVAGAFHYMAPEIHKALTEGKPPHVNLATDRYSLGMLLHEMLVWAHVASAGRDEDEVKNAMYGGRWVFDPVHGGAPAGVGLPPTALSSDVQGLFRRTMSLDPPERPSAAEWRRVLLSAIWSVWECPYCGGPVIIDVSKRECPYCRKAYPRLALAVEGGGTVLLADGVTVLGRAVLGSTPTLSEPHAVVRRKGPEYWLESRGRNGTFRFDRSASAWRLFPPNKEILVRPGDTLRFADVTARAVVSA